MSNTEQPKFPKSSDLVLMFAPGFPGVRESETEVNHLYKMKGFVLPPLFRGWFQGPSSSPMECLALHV